MNNNDNFNGINNMQSNIPDDNKTGFESYANINGGKKNNNFIVILLIIIVTAGVAFGAFQFGRMYSGKTINVEETGKNEEKNGAESKKEDEKENLDSNEKIDKEEKEEVKKEPVKNSNFTFYKERKENFKVDGVNLDIVAYYYLDNEDWLDIYSDKREQRTMLRREVFLNGTLIGGTQILNTYVGIDLAIEEDSLKDVLLFKDSVTNDYVVIYNLEYLDGFENGTYNAMNIDTLANAYIIGKDMNVLKVINLKYNKMGITGVLVDDNGAGDRKRVMSTFMEDHFYGANLRKYPYVLYSESVLDVKDNFIYYLAFDSSSYSDDANVWYPGVEYKLQVENGVLKEEVITRYSNEQFFCAGAC